jgi:hypothetical protein
MAELDLRDMLLIVVAVAAVLVILYMAIRIMFKAKRGSSSRRSKKSKVLKALPKDEGAESDSIFNTIIATKRIASDLRRRGINTSEAESIIKKAESEYDLGREKTAKIHIEDAKNNLLNLKNNWDQKTGFDVVPESQPQKPKKSFRDSSDLGVSDLGSSEVHLEPEKEFPELKKAVDKKPDNFLPSKFTISLAQKTVYDAESAGQDTSEAQRLLISAKDCFESEDYDEAFRLALCCKREAEALLGFGSKTTESEDKGISDLSTISKEAEPLKVCTICGNKRVAYICIESESGEEATCKQCYDEAMGATVMPELPPPPPPPPPDFKGEIPKPDEKKEEKEQHFCPNCGAKVTAEDVFCGKCGKPVKEELKCVGCGTKVEPGDVFCRKCGARLVT